MNVVVVGGGISGLATAHAVLERDPAADVVVLEKGARLGGNVVTVREGGFVIDGGPDSWVATKPHATALAKKLGLGGDLIETIPENRRALILWNGRLHPLPEGFVMGVPTSVMPIVRTPLFSAQAKLRMALEPLIPRRRLADGEDESIESFVRRRLGQEVVDRLVGPLLGGVYGGDAAKLSVKATLPQFVEMEAKKGSLIHALKAARAATGGGGKPSLFTSLRGGVGALVDALAASLGPERIRTNVAVSAVARSADGDARGRFAVTTEAGETRYADHVVVAVPAHAASALLRGCPRVAGALSDIPYVSTSIVAMSFPRASVASRLDATGYIVPRVLGRPAIAVTWISSKWAGRAPDGQALLRVFLGGAEAEELALRDDATLERLAREELSRTMGITAAPTMTRVFRFVRASLQPLVGHTVRMQAVRERLTSLPGLHLVASGYDGIGIPDCVRQADDAARVITGQALNRVSS